MSGHLIVQDKINEIKYKMKKNITIKTVKLDLSDQKFLDKVKRRKEFPEISSRHLDLKDKFFDLVKVALEENIKHVNINIGFLKTANSEDIKDIQKSFLNHQTRWSDDRLLIPVLFNLFHGIELFLTGIKYSYETPEFDKNNKPNNDPIHLLSDFKKEYPKKTTIIDILEFYVHPNEDYPILSAFFKENKIVHPSAYIDTHEFPSNQSFAKGFDWVERELIDEHKRIEFFEKIISDINILLNQDKQFWFNPW